MELEEWERQNWFWLFLLLHMLLSRKQKIWREGWYQILNHLKEDTESTENCLCVFWNYCIFQKHPSGKAIMLAYEPHKSWRKVGNVRWRRRKKKGLLETVFSSEDLGQKASLRRKKRFSVCNQMWKNLSFLTSLLEILSSFGFQTVPLLKSKVILPCHWEIKKFGYWKDTITKFDFKVYPL